MADRYTYVPLIGLFVATVWGVCESAGFRRWSRFAPAATVLTLGACIALTVHQEMFWKDSETFNKRLIKATSRNFLGHNNLGTVLNLKGQTGQAIQEFREAIELNPGYPDAHYNLGLALLRQDQVDEAILELRQAITLKVKRPEAHNMLGAALGQKGQFGQAIGEFQEAIRLEPGNYGAHFNLARVYWSQGQTNEAIGELRETVRLQPGFEEAQKILGSLEGKK
jgi:tetratricopeptide (TPR) repeat protein